MDSQGFQFKQFFVAHNQCAMKVGTDSILLGSWVASFSHLLTQGVADNTLAALDIGTGSGVLTLMLAQTFCSKNHAFPTAQLVAIEPEPHAFKQACDNFSASPWQPFIRAVKTTVQAFRPHSTQRFTHQEFPHHGSEGSRIPAKYHVIVANPPYFDANNTQRKTQNTLRPLAREQHFRGVGNTDFSPERQSARHQTHLNLSDLAQNVVRFLSPNGRFFCILPVAQAEQFRLIAVNKGLFLNSQLLVAPNEKKGIHRVMMELSLIPSELQSGTITIRDNSHQYTNDFRDLCRNFYLKF